MGILSIMWEQKRLKIYLDTEIRNFPLFCPKCKQEILINVNQFQIAIIKV